MRGAKGLSIWGAGLVMLLITACATPRRAPAPFVALPAERATDLAPGTQVQPPMDDSAASQATYHFSLGQSYGLEGDTDKAIEEYKLALVYDPDSAVIHTRLATEYVKRGLLSFAVESCKNALRLDPKYTDARMLLAGLYGATKLTKEALKEYDAILADRGATDEARREVYVFKGSLLIEEGRPAEAVATLRKLTKDDPESFLGFFYLGKAYEKSGEMDKAVRSYRKVLEIRPAFSQAAMSLGQLYESKGREKDALKVYEEFFNESRDGQAAARLAQHYVDKGDYGKALRYLLVLEQQDEDNLNVRVKIGLIYVELKQYRKAVAAFEGILRRHPDADRVRYYLGSVHEETKDYDKAINVFRAVSEGSSSYADAAVHVGYLYKMKGDGVMAEEWIDKAISRNGDVPQYYTFKASLVEESKGVAQAIEVLEPVKDKFSKDEKLLYYLGALYDKGNRQDDALKVMAKILEVSPDNANALNYVGYTLAVRGEDLDSAESMVRRALKLRPDDAYIQDSLGFVLLRKGRKKEALVALEKAYRMKPQEAVIAEHLGDAYTQANLRGKALQKYVEASKLYSDPTERSKVERKIDDMRGITTQQRLPAGEETTP